MSALATTPALDGQTAAWLNEQSDENLRLVIAGAAGVLAAREGSVLTARTLANIATALARPRMVDIAREVADTYGLTVGDLRDTSPRKAIAWPRQEFMWRAAQVGHAKAAIGRFLNRDHTTVIFGIRSHMKREAER